MVRACEYDGLSLKRLNYMKKDFADVIKILNQLTKITVGGPDLIR